MRMSLTEKNREWLNKMYQGECAKEPIWGYHKGWTEPGHIARFCRTLNLLRIIMSSSDKITNLLDVGAGEGNHVALIRELLSHCDISISDLSLSVMQKAHNIFGLRCCAADSSNLPFADSSFDLVLCSETIEHTARPFRTISELVRVARKAILITTEAALPLQLHRLIALKTRDTHQPCFDRNIWHAQDFLTMFKDRAFIFPQFARNLIYHSEPSDTEIAKKFTLEMANVYKVSAKTMGIIALITKRKDYLPSRSFSMDHKILELMFEGTANALAKKIECWDNNNVSLVVCPHCRNKNLKISNFQEIICESCQKNYGKVDTAIDFLSAKIADGDLSDEIVAIKNLVAEQTAQRYFLKLEYRFREKYAESNIFFYFFFRLLRRAFRLIYDTILRY